MSNIPLLLPRGCGERKPGGIYAECGLSEDGAPLERFLIDPPAAVDEQALGLSSVGVKLIDFGDTCHVFDIVGQEHYPNVADFVEEVRRMGASRRLARTIDYARLTRDTKLVLLHRRARIGNTVEYFSAMGRWPSAHWACPKGLAGHTRSERPPAMCAGLWWRDVEGGEPTGAIVDGLVQVERRMPSFSYTACARPAGIAPLYELAIFMILPLTRIAVVRGANGEHEPSLDAASAARVPVELVDG